jgi:homoprotocatechuate degradation regulator HpaR
MSERGVAARARSAARAATPVRYLRDLEHSLPLQLLKAREAAMTHFRPMLRRHGLTDQQWRVLRVLAAEPGLTASDLARRSYLLPPSLTRILRLFEQRRLVNRSGDDADLRRAVFALTTRGSALFAEVAPDSEELYGEIAARFGVARLESLYALLHEFSVVVAVEEVRMDAEARAPDL